MVDRIAAREVDPYTAATDLLGARAQLTHSPSCQFTDCMKAVLDHVGIAVKDLAAALAFYRDALGLEVEAARGGDVAARARAFRPGRGVEARAARGDGAGFGDRQVCREARSRPPPHHAAGRRHRRGGRPAQGARRPADRRTAAARRGGLDWSRSSIRPRRTACSSSSSNRRSPTRSRHPQSAIGHLEIHARRVRADFVVRRFSPHGRRVDVRHRAEAAMVRGGARRRA